MNMNSYTLHAGLPSYQEGTTAVRLQLESGGARCWSVTAAELSWAESPALESRARAAKARTEHWEYRTTRLQLAALCGEQWPVTATEVAESRGRRTGVGADFGDCSSGAAKQSGARE